METQDTNTQDTNTQEKMLDDEPKTETTVENTVTVKTEDKPVSRKCGAFWTRQGQNGETYLSGEITLENKTYSVFLFKNKSKVKPNHPDFELVFPKPMTNKSFI